MSADESITRFRPLIEFRCPPLQSVAQGEKRVLATSSTIPAGKTWLTQRRRLNVAGVIFILPSIVLFAAFLAGPLLYALYISFHKWSMLGHSDWIGLDNYRRIFRDDIFMRSLKNTLLFS